VKFINQSGFGERFSSDTAAPACTNNCDFDLSHMRRPAIIVIVMQFSALFKQIATETADKWVNSTQ
jgi:hypothetical protein